MCASLQSCGTVPWSLEYWYCLASTGASSSAASLKIILKMRSGTVALHVFNCESCLCTHLVLNKRSRPSMGMDLALCQT